VTIVDPRWRTRRSIFPRWVLWPRFVDDETFWAERIGNDLRRLDGIAESFDPRRAIIQELRRPGRRLSFAWCPDLRSRIRLAGTGNLPSSGNRARRGRVPPYSGPIDLPLALRLVLDRWGRNFVVELIVGSLLPRVAIVAVSGLRGPNFGWIATFAVIDGRNRFGPRDQAGDRDHVGDIVSGRPGLIVDRYRRGGTTNHRRACGDSRPTAPGQTRQQHQPDARNPES
jgi:hypothetical protein